MEEIEQSYCPFDEDITMSIEENKVAAVTDASVKGASMGGAWIITNIEKSLRCVMSCIIRNGKITHQEWLKL